MRKHLATLCALCVLMSHGTSSAESPEPDHPDTTIVTTSGLIFIKGVPYEHPAFAIGDRGIAVNTPGGKVVIWDIPDPKSRPEVSRPASEQHLFSMKAYHLIDSLRKDNPSVDIGPALTQLCRKEAVADSMVRIGPEAFNVFWKDGTGEVLRTDPYTGPPVPVVTTKWRFQPEGVEFLQRIVAALNSNGIVVMWPSGMPPGRPYYGQPRYKLFTTAETTRRITLEIVRALRGEKKGYQYLDNECLKDFLPMQEGR
jgi:hypothetical protein